MHSKSHYILRLNLLGAALLLALATPDAQGEGGGGLLHGDTSRLGKTLAQWEQIAERCELSKYPTAKQTYTGPHLEGYCKRFMKLVNEKAQVEQTQARADDTAYKSKAEATKAKSAGSTNQANSGTHVKELASDGQAFKNKSLHRNRMLRNLFKEGRKFLKDYVEDAQKEVAQLQREADMHSERANTLCRTLNAAAIEQCRTEINSAREKRQKARDLDDYTDDVSKKDNSSPALFAEREETVYAAGEIEVSTELEKLGKMLTGGQDVATGMDTKGGSTGASDAMQWLQVAQAADGLAKKGPGSSHGDGAISGGGALGSNTSLASGSREALGLNSSRAPTSSASMANPSSIFNNGRSPGSGVGSSLTGLAKRGLGDTTSASVSDLKEKLRAERASRSAGNVAGSRGGLVGGTMSDPSPTSDAPNQQNGDQSAGLDAGAGLGGMGLSMSLGDPGFDDKMKDLLGLGKEEGALSDEEQKLLHQSRELASLGSAESGNTGPGVLGADSVSLFDRTKNQITISLKKGRILNGLSAKLK